VVLHRVLGGAAGWDRTTGYTPKGEVNGGGGVLVRFGAGSAPSR
jgi:hypothetical protein